MSDADKREPSFSFPKPSKVGEKAGAPPKPPASSRGPGRPPKDSLKVRLTAEFTFIGTTVFFVNQYDGQVILTKAADTAEALDKLASENPRVKKALEGMLAFSTWSAVGMAVSSMLIPIAANHGLAPPQFAMMFGVPNPEDHKPVENAGAMGNG